MLLLIYVMNPRMWQSHTEPQILRMSYVLSKKGENLKVEYVGAIDNNSDDATKANKTYVADAVNSLLKGESVTVPSTKAIGCSIKWKN